MLILLENRDGIWGYKIYDSNGRLVKAKYDSEYTKDSLKTIIREII
jgi:hypothetical protein